MRQIYRLANEATKLPGQYMATSRGRRTFSSIHGLLRYLLIARLLHSHVSVIGKLFRPLCTQPRLPLFLQFGSGSPSWASGLRHERFGMEVGLSLMPFYSTPATGGLRQYHYYEVGRERRYRVHGDARQARAD